MSLKIYIFFNIKAIRQQNTVKYKIGFEIIEKKKLIQIVTNIKKKKKFIVKINK